MNLHELKTVDPFFNDVWRGYKRFEIRKNDRNFQVGDFLLLREFNSSMGQYLKRELLCKIIYIYEGDYLSKNYVILGIIIIERILGE